MSGPDHYFYTTLKSHIPFHDPMRRLYIFDLDGTLMDSTNTEKQCFIRTFDSLGMGYRTSDLDVYVNQNLESTFSGIDDGSHTYEEFVHRFMSEASRSVDDGTVPFPDTRETLEGIASCGIPMCIATRMGGRRARGILERHGLDGFFDLIVGAEDVVRHKPDPECVFKCLDFHDVSAEDAVFIGDSPKDMYAADGANVEGILIDRTHRYQTFEDHRIVRDLREILDGE